MAKVKVFYGRGYDIRTDSFPTTKRRGTEETLEDLGLQVVRESMEEVDESDLDGDGFVKRAGPEAFIELNKPK